MTMDTTCTRCGAPPPAVFDDTRWTALLITLDCAVAVRIGDLAAMDPADRARTITSWARTGAAAIAAHGDVLQYGGDKTAKGRAQVAGTFNALARGLAALAYAPGGVTFAGRHWCTPDPTTTVPARPVVDLPLPEEAAT